MVDKFFAEAGRSPLLPTKRLSRIVITATLSIAALLINLIPVHLFAGISVYLGNVAVILVAWLFGPWWAFLAALLSVSGHQFLGSGPGYGGFLLLAEAIFVGVARRRGYQLYFSDIAYWLLIGAPAGALMYMWQSDFVVSPRLLVLRDISNGLLCAVLAVFLIPVLQKLTRYSDHQPVVSSLRTQLFYSISVIVSGFMLVSGLYFATIHARQAEASIDQKITARAAQFGQIVSDHLENSQQLMRTAASLLAATDPDQWSELLSRFHAENPAFRTMIVVNQEARVTVGVPLQFFEAALARGESMEVSDRDYFQASVIEGRDYISPVFRGRGFGDEPIVAISSPVRDQQTGKIIGLVEGSMDLLKFMSVALSHMQLEADSIVLEDQRGSLVFSSVDPVQQSLQPFDRQVITDAGLRMTVIRVGTGEERYFLGTAVLGNGWRAYALSPLGPALADLEQQMFSVLVLVIFSTLFVGLFSGLVTSRLSLPLDHIIRTMNEGKMLRQSPIDQRFTSLPAEIHRLYEDLARIQDELLNKQKGLEAIVESRNQELQDSEQRLRFALDASGSGVWDWNLETNVMYFSNEWKQQLGYDALFKVDAEIVIELIHKDDVDSVMRVLSEHLAGRSRAYVHEHRLRTQGGSYRWILGRGMVTHRDATGKPLRFVGTDTDITENKVTEAQERRENKMNALGTLTGGIAHDYNNMLNIIRGYAELLVNELSSDPEQQEQAQEIIRATERGENLTRKLMSFSRQRNSRLEELSLDDVIFANIGMLQTLLTNRISVQWLPGANGEMVMLNRDEFEDALINLCINAMHAMDGSGTIRISSELVDVSVAEADQFNLQPGRFVRLVVADSGAGMDEETLSSVFDPYFSTKEHGMGLGLSQTYGMVQRSHGAIDVSSAPGEGAEFRLWFPALGREKTGQSEPGNHQSESAGDFAGLRALVVDDEAALARLSARMLSENGFEVTLLSDAQMALDKLASGESYDVLITDILMPGVNGYQLARQAVASLPGIRVLFVSGYGGSGDELSQLDFPFVLLSKPYTIDRFLTTLKDLFQQP
ncbi:MAG: PAS domain-containing protein [Pseudomonadales bacterium]|nr:PAS domain-containing protein [Pseudomonadales bacterium]